MAVAASERLPDRQVNCVLHELNMALAEQRIDAPRVPAARRDVEREPVPELAGAVAVRQVAAAVVPLVVGTRRW